MERCLTVHEVQTEILRCGRKQVYDLIQSGRLRHIRIGMAIRIPESAVREFLEQGGTLGKSSTKAKTAGRQPAADRR